MDCMYNKIWGCIFWEDGYLEKVDFGEEFSSGGLFVYFYFVLSLV